MPEYKWRGVYAGIQMAGQECRPLSFGEGWGEVFKTQKGW